MSHGCPWAAACSLVAVLSSCADAPHLAQDVLGTPRWAVSIGGSLDDDGHSVAIDSVGDVVAAGLMSSAPDEPESAAGSSGFIAKFVGGDGSQRWTVLLRGTTASSSARVAAIAAGIDDSILATGHFSGSVDFGGQVLSVPVEETDTFVARYDRNGRLLWVRSLGAGSLSSGEAIAVDQHRVVITGTFAGTLTAGALSYETLGLQDAFLIAFSDDGEFLWGRAFQGPQYQMGTSLGIRDGNVVVVGTFTGDATFGGDALSGAERSLTFVTGFREDGLYLFSQVLGPAGPGVAREPRVALLDGGAFVVSQVEQEDKTRYLYIEAVRSFDSRGRLSWTSRAETDNNTVFRALGALPNGLILTATWARGPHSLHVSPDILPGTVRVVVRDKAGRIDATSFGNRVEGGNEATGTRGFAVGRGGDLAFVGKYSGVIDLGTGPLRTQGANDEDVFVVLLSP